MHTVVYSRPSAQHESHRGGQVARAALRVAHGVSTTRYSPDSPYSQGDDSDQRFVAMLDAYRASGGLARAEEVLAMFRRCSGPDVAVLARWIAQRELICFEWQQQTWMPLFQFDRVHLCPDVRLQAVFTELNCVYDQWEIGNWFALPNAWLAERSPVEALSYDFSAVLDAARADRFVAAG